MACFIQFENVCVNCEVDIGDVPEMRSVTGHHCFAVAGP